MMADKVYISNITITTKKEKKVLTKKEIEKFCAERVKISVKETYAKSAINKKQKKSKKNLQLAKKNAVPKIGDLVFAKVRGFSDWPAIVKEINEPNHVWVDFFNSTEM